MTRLFISQERMDIWTSENRILLEGDKMTLTENNRSFTIESAAHFVSVAGGDPDVSGLLGKVKSESELAEMGAEQLSDSVIHGDVAYEVVCGFIGNPLPKG